MNSFSLLVCVFFPTNLSRLSFPFRSFLPSLTNHVPDSPHSLCSFPTAIDMIANDMVCVNKLVSKCYPMEECQEAFDDYHKNYECYCCMLNCN